MIALYLGSVYLLLELLLIESIIPWIATYPFVFLLITIACTFISIKYKNPVLVIGCFIILVILDFYYVVLTLNENIYIEIIDDLMFPESFPYVHAIIVLVSLFSLAYFTHTKSKSIGNSGSLSTPAVEENSPSSKPRGSSDHLAVKEITEPSSQEH